MNGVELFQTNLRDLISEENNTRIEFLDSQIIQTAPSIYNRDQIETTPSNLASSEEIASKNSSPKIKRKNNNSHHRYNLRKN
jgi:hypothetical protein